MALHDQPSIHEIARRTGLSRNTIQKYLRSGDVTPKFSIPERPSKQHKTVKLLYKDLAAPGYGGSYERVATFARSWRSDRLRDEQSI